MKPPKCKFGCGQEHGIICPNIGKKKVRAVVAEISSAASPAVAAKPQRKAAKKLKKAPRRKAAKARSAKTPAPSASVPAERES